MKITIFFMVLFVLLFAYFVYIHEEVHVQIYKKYGIESHVEWFSNFPDVSTIAEAPCPTAECRLGHHINEAISYVLMPLFLLIGFGLTFIIGFLEGRE